MTLPRVDGIFICVPNMYSRLTLPKLFRKKSILWYTHKGSIAAPSHGRAPRDKIFTASKKIVPFKQKIEVVGHGIDIDF